MRPLFFTIFLLASCGGAGDEPQGNGAADLPQPSGPPVAQQVDASSPPWRPSTRPAWEAVESGQGTALRLTEPDGRVLLSIACAGSPARLLVHAPGFSRIESEDRFSLGLGSEPVTLVADPTRQFRPGVTAEGPLPEDFKKLWAEAKELSAVYGTQRVGPFRAPEEAPKEAFSKACAGSQ